MKIQRGGLDTDEYTIRNQQLIISTDLHRY